jgi:predicted DsbA family dithiol-disulfide isomerase
MAAYFVDGEAVGEPDVLAWLATEAGLEQSAVREVLDSDRFAAEVLEDELEARRLGISGVPFFVIDRTYGISGAQPSELMLSTLDQAWAESHPLTMVPVGADDASCTDESCIR